MSIFSGPKSCVFSEVTVKVLKDGKPVQNAKVLRQWEWNKEKSDQTSTDNQGVAHFPAVFESSVSRLLPTEFVVGQQLSVWVDGEEQVFFTNSKREPDENSEFGGAPFKAVCELTDEEVLIEDYGSLMVSKCKLEN